MKKKLHLLASRLMGNKNFDAMVVKFWGVRGTLPVCGKKAVKYGGNTNCVTLEYKDQFLVFDAGTGIKELSNYLVKHKKLPLSAKIFITHPHYDHINGIPFFAPLYLAGNEFEFFGANHGGYSIGELISRQMDSVYFPVTTKEFASKFTFRNLGEENFLLGDLAVKTILLNHPGKSLGYRIQQGGKSFCYITDNELYLETSPEYQGQVVENLVDFIRGTDLLVIDTTYNTDWDYKQKSSWGHSCVSRVVDVAARAKVKKLCLYHHDPDQMDKDIDAKLKKAKAMLKNRHSRTICIAAKEGETIVI